MSGVVGEYSAAARSFSLGGRITVTVLLLVLPACCLGLALTAPDGWAGVWFLIAGLNLVLPAVILPFVWRRADEPARVPQPGTADHLAR